MAIAPVTIKYDDKVVSVNSGDRITLHTNTKRLRDNIVIQAAEKGIQKENYDGSVIVENIEEVT